MQPTRSSKEGDPTSHVKFMTLPNASAPRRFDEIHGVSLAERARETLRAAILGGSLRPGERMTIEQLAAELGVSRTPVREALKALEQDGLVRLMPHRGAVVEPVAREELHHRYTIRAMLEGYAAELACEVDAHGVASDLAANCDELEALAATAKPGDSEATRRLSQLNQEFHATIRDRAGSRTLVRLLASLRNPVTYTDAHWGDPDRRRASIVIHREIANAFRQGQPELTRSLMERHIIEARDALMASDHPELAEPSAQR